MAEGAPHDVGQHDRWGGPVSKPDAELDWARGWFKGRGRKGNKTEAQGQAEAEVARQAARNGASEPEIARAVEEIRQNPPKQSKEKKRGLGPLGKGCLGWAVVLGAAVLGRKMFVRHLDELDRRERGY